MLSLVEWFNFSGIHIYHHLHESFVVAESQTDVVDNNLLSSCQLGIGEIYDEEPAKTNSVSSIPGGHHQHQKGEGLDFRKK